MPLNWWLAKQVVVMVEIASPCNDTTFQTVINKITTNKMKRIILTALILSTSLLYSCQEVIELDLNSSNPVVVVDGEISLGKSASIQLSYTSDYFTSEAQQTINDALVTLTSSSGEVEVLKYTQNGRYVGTEIIGQENTTYELQVELADKNFVGTSSIMSDFSITQLNIIESIINKPSFGKNGTSDSMKYNVELVFTDDSNQENNYLLQVLKNGEVGEFQNLLITDQQFARNGLITYNPMMYQFSMGDTAQFRLISIDKETYQFYNQLADVSGSSGMQSMMNSGTPYNPSSNMGDDVVGYFAAWAIVDTTIVIQ